MKKICLCVVVLGVLSACHSFNSEINYKLKMGEWIGKNAADLYSVWGTPQQVQPIDADAYVVTFYQQESTPIDNNYMPYMGVVSAEAMNEPQYGISSQPPLFYCQTSFEIRNNIVVDYSFNGDDCY